MASLSWPWEPLEPKERLALQGLRREWEASDEFSYDPYFEQDKTPSERAYDEANRDIEPQMEEWRAEE